MKYIRYIKHINVRYCTFPFFTLLPSVLYNTFFTVLYCTWELHLTPKSFPWEASNMINLPIPRPKYVTGSDGKYETYWSTGEKSASGFERSWDISPFHATAQSRWMDFPNRFLAIHHWGYKGAHYTVSVTAKQMFCQRSKYLTDPV